MHNAHEASSCKLHETHKGVYYSNTTPFKMVFYIFVHVSVRIVIHDIVTTKLDVTMMLIMW